MEAAQGVILFGHGARDPEWAGPMERVQARMRAQRPRVAVELAFMEFLSPTLQEAAGRLVAQGVGSITVVPVFLAQGGHLKRDVPLLVAQLGQAYPGCPVALAQAVGESDEVVAAVADYAARCVQA